MEDNQTLLEEGELEGADVDELDSTSYSDDADTSDEDGENQNSDFLSKAKEITGREFKDEEDFKKHYKNLSSFVGKKVEAKVVKPVKAENDRVAELEFKVDYPELKEHFDVIKMVARERGKSYSEVVSDPLVKELLDVRQSKKGESVIHSNNKISSSNPNLTKLKQNANTKEGLAAYLMALNEELNGLLARLTKPMADSLFKTYEAIGNREDLTDIIANISPTDTPMLSRFGKTKAKNTLHI